MLCETVRKNGQGASSVRPEQWKSVYSIICKGCGKKAIKVRMLVKVMIHSPGL